MLTTKKRPVVLFLSIAVALLVLEHVIEDGPDPVVKGLVQDVFQASDHVLLGPDVLLDGLVKFEGGGHVDVQGSGGHPGLDVDEGLAEGRVLHAVVDYGLEEGGDEAVAHGLYGGLDLLDVGQLQCFLLFKEFDQV